MQTIRKASSVWQGESEAHRARVGVWTKDRLHRGRSGRKHPVYDFLFEYYAFRPSHLERYSPGLGVFLESATTNDLDWADRYSYREDGAILNPATFPIHRLPMLRWAVRFLQQSMERPPLFHCYGLHEWAMVYRSEAIRHPQIPLRLAPEQITAFVESQALCCTHFDAFRFFTTAASPRNRFQLDRFSNNEYEQPGCIHATMDLYKWSFQLMPYLSSKLLADAFELAVTAREIDMRASPYDLRALGFPPIPIETTQGREEYTMYQQALYEKAQPIRQSLLVAYYQMEQEVSKFISAA
ncbi:MAG TPA: 3-methyladenine DNA glycosylase [Gemmatales bacterium]|nr:3-methyladenine DNA glycosylase [Gemmatales bacterium]